ncbi:MAG: ribosome recycling factor [Acidaminococcaceae bacterium]|jgi:ribosome recycling factor|nr:ribosome recycling factor [Acidaminococcaceae bacterium]MBO6182969.1 ribosome recycling factor [Acidaminococcaceae bacterium]MBO6266355.1 ribosome recycling factor [Acidaminococcaceae bacterium]MBP3264582.1 ribosome recycling factor [Acidaminococcaceae bacterium]MBQ5344597.1 ribosome recycling factor [Acidaminococcaceae bacterium]
MATIEEMLASNEDKMKKTISYLREDLAGLRAGRATPALLNKIMVDYYGTPTPVNQVANVAVPEPRMIVITPWEKTMIKAISKAIMTSDLGLNPNTDGSVIRLNLPQLTEDRRKELVKTARKRTEEARVTVRGLRRDIIEGIKKAEKAKQVTEDDSKEGQENAQKLTDKMMKEIDKVIEAKEKEIMEV